MHSIESGFGQSAANLVSRPADLFHELVVAAPEFVALHEPFDIAPRSARFDVVGIAHDRDHAGFLQPDSAGPVALESLEVVDVEKEVAARIERAGNRSSDLLEIGMARKMIEGVSLAGDEIYAMGQSEGTHIGAEDLQRQAFAGGFCMRRLTHGWREVYGKDGESETGESKGRSSGSAGKVTGGMNAREDTRKKLVAGSVDRQTKGAEEFVVKLSKPLIRLG